jgi:hypothetical protein
MKRGTHFLTPGQSTGTFCTWRRRSNSFGMYPGHMPAGRIHAHAYMLVSLSNGPCSPYRLAGSRLGCMFKLLPSVCKHTVKSCTSPSSVAPSVVSARNPRQQRQGGSGWSRGKRKGRRTGRYVRDNRVFVVARSSELRHTQSGNHRRFLVTHQRRRRPGASADLEAHANQPMHESTQQALARSVTLL